MSPFLYVCVCLSNPTCKGSSPQVTLLLGWANGLSLMMMRKRLRTGFVLSMTGFVLSMTGFALCFTLSQYLILGVKDLLAISCTY